MDQYTLDIRVFGVPERMENILLTKETLGIPDENIFIDRNHDGCIPTARRAWAKETDKTHVLVLQDDIELCINFKHICEVMINTHPDVILSLFSWMCIYRKKMRQWPSTPYVYTDKRSAASGQGIIMPADWITPCLETWKDERHGDDININWWAHNNKKPIVTTFPTILQHIGKQSAMGYKRHNVSTEFYDPNPADVDWKCERIEAWENVRRR